MLAYYRARNKRGQLLKPCEGNDRAIQDAMPIEPGLFAEFCKDDKFASQFAWIDPPLPKKQALRQDTQAFEAFCVQNRYNAGEAGFELARELLGPGQVTEANLIQAVRTGKLRLGMATPEDLEDRREAALDAEKLRLMNTPAHKIKQEVAAGAKARRIEAQRQHRDYEFSVKQAQESGMQYEPLPQMLPDFLAKRYGNIRLDRAFLIKKADRDAFRFLHQKFGMTQVEQLLRGEI